MALLTRHWILAGVFCAASCTTTPVDDNAEAGTEAETESPRSGEAGGTHGDGGASGPGSDGAEAPGESGADEGGSSDSGNPTTGGTTSGGPTSGSSSVGTVSATSSSEGGSTTEGGAEECQENSDCALVNDCCSCEATTVGGTTKACPITNCFAPQCDIAGVSAAVCRLGRCVLEAKNDCGHSNVVCLAAQPQCSDGQVAEVESGCWSGRCVPQWSCDTVPDCSYCDGDEFCARTETQLGVEIRCEPLPQGCGGAPDCECAGEACEPFECRVDGDGLGCFCPQC